MVDGFKLNEIFSAPNTNLGILFVICLFVWRMWNSGPAMGETWILWQQTKAADKAAHHSHLQEEIRRLSEAEKQCRRDYTDLFSKYMEMHERLSALEGYHMGQGRVSQEAAVNQDKKPSEDK